MNSILISNKDIKILLKECFETDKDLLEKWHIESAKGLEKCVNRTYKDFIEYNVKVYKLLQNNELVGYYGIENKEFLTGFFIKPEFRNKETVKEFWKIVDNEFEKDYMAALYMKNTPAINFLNRKGSVIGQVSSMESILFLIKKES